MKLPHHLLLGLLLFLGNHCTTLAMEKSVLTPEERQHSLNEQLTTAILAPFSQAEAEVNQLLKDGADIHYVDKSGMTPLQVSVHCEKVDMTDMLLKRGASLDQVTKPASIKKIQFFELLPAGSTVFHLAASCVPKNAIPLQHTLFHHALFHPKKEIISHEAVIALFYGLKKINDVLYINRFNLIMPYVIDHLSPDTLLRFLGSTNKPTQQFAHGVLEKRMRALQKIISLKNGDGKTAYMIECEDKIRNNKKSPDTLLLPTLYEEQLKELSTMVQKSGTTKGLPDSNVFEAAYTANIPKDQSWFSYIPQIFF